MSVDILVVSYIYFVYVKERMSTMNYLVTFKYVVYDWRVRYVSVYTILTN